MEFEPKKKKYTGFPISTTDCTYAFCTSGTFYTGDLKKMEIFVAYSSGPPDNDWFQVWFLVDRKKVAFLLRIKNFGLVSFFPLLISSIRILS